MPALEGKNGHVASSHSVFPGITLIYFSAHAQETRLEECPPLARKNVFEIFHCREGRMELSIAGDYCYISPGDLLIARAGSIAPSVYFPLRHYHGLVIHIDIDRTPRCFSCILQDVHVQPQLIAERFCGEKGYFIARSNPSFEHIFSEMHSIPESIKQGYAKIKVLELMLFLSAFDAPMEMAEQRPLSPSQVQIAKAVAKYLSEHLEERFTLDQAAEMFSVSATNIKNSFKAVYGVSFYAFVKARKMESAAYMLEYTDKPITEIAGEHGYDNSGKFASAFRAVKGVSPGEYRQKNQKIHRGGEVWRTPSSL